jgi:hypothetical protein
MRILFKNAGSYLKTIILPVVLYGCETWNIDLRVFKNRVLRIYGPKRDQGIGGWRKLHEELHNLYSSPSTIRIMKSLRMR